MLDGISQAIQSPPEAAVLAEVDRKGPDGETAILESKGDDVVDKPTRAGLSSRRDRPVTKGAGFGYLPALFGLFFGFALRGCGGAFKMRRSASSNGIGVRSGLLGFAFIVTFLSVYYVAWGSDWAKFNLFPFLAPMRTEARPVCRLEGVPIISEAVKQQAFLPGLDIDSLVLSKNSVLSVDMVPIGRNDEFRKNASLSVVQSLVRDRIGSDNNVGPELRQECWAFADVVNRPSEAKSTRAYVSRWPSFGAFWS